MACTVSKLISLNLYCLLAWKVMWFENYFIRSTIVKILYNKLSCVNERVHSWLMWTVNLSHREWISTFLYICRFYKWDFLNGMLQGQWLMLFLSTDLICPKGTSEALVCILWCHCWLLESCYLCNKCSNSWILMTAKTFVPSVLIYPKTHMFVFTSIQFNCQCQICFLTIFRGQNVNDVQMILWWKPPSEVSVIFILFSQNCLI